ncbi:MAG TPA: hypothetical protein VME70_04905 [Mycobacteriales bacterium]|nr:hypothetical protein [Mycobacteriales bacterium]
MTTSSEITHRHRTMASGGLAVWAPCIADAVLILISGEIHFHLWRGPYRHLTVGHINDLFLLQVIGCLVVAIAIVATRHLLTVLAGAGLMAGTFIGFLISHYRSAGLFGWHDPYTTSDSNWALAVEIAATVLCLVTAAVLWRSSRPSASA